jgi:hypothetical protein
MKITAKGKSAHAAANHLGDNAIYKMLPIIEAISKLEPALGDHEFLGHGKITVSDMKVSTPSINAVPDECTIFIDRRMTFGESKEGVKAQIEALIPAEQKDKIVLEELFYDDPSYTGFVFPVDKYFRPGLLRKIILWWWPGKKPARPSACPTPPAANGASAPTASTGPAKRAFLPLALVLATN